MSTRKTMFIVFTIVGVIPTLYVLTSISSPAQNRMSDALSASSSTEKYHNYYFHYRLTLPKTFVVSGALDNSFGVPDVDLTQVETLPVVEISNSHSTTSPAGIRVEHNSEQLSPREWAFQTIARFKDNDIQSEGDVSIGDHAAYEITFKGLYTDKPGSSADSMPTGSTSDQYMRFVFIPNAGRMLIAYYPTDKKDSRLFENVVSSLVFE